MSLDNEERLVGYDVAMAMAGVSRAEIQRRIKDKRVNRRPILTPYRRPILTPLSGGFWR
jgi:hypothetical protein